MATVGTVPIGRTCAATGRLKSYWVTFAPLGLTLTAEGVVVSDPAVIETLSGHVAAPGLAKYATTRALRLARLSGLVSLGAQKRWVLLPPPALSLASPAGAMACRRSALFGAVVHPARLWLFVLFLKYHVWNGLAMTCWVGVGLVSETL